MHTMLQRARELEDKYIAYRRQFHRHPEAGWQEVETAATVMAHLDSLGIPYQRVGATAVVGLITGGIPNDKCIAIRADMDALPITERTDLEYSSQIPGMMHACGHDGHTAILMGVAALLKEKQAQIKGKIKLFFQPAEEGPGGAKPMIEGGCMENPRVDATIGLHLDVTDYHTGEVGFRDGASTASTDGFVITVRGNGGHGAHPHLSVDAIVCAGQLVSALQSIVSREVSPIESAVITVGTINGGYRGNVIADQVVLDGTIRTLSPQVREGIPQRMERVLQGICAAYRCQGELQIRQGVPSVINDSNLTNAFEQSAIALLGSSQVKRVPYPTMGGEDFSYYGQKAPACFIRLGGRNEDIGCTNPGHHPKYNFDEQAIAVGMATLAQMALDYLEV
ncbi:MAG: amidohydrolase [Symbiobacteriaceae bacterium]|nr:amidohydrolase [Symbiobacteriaceae bacterium]